MVRAGGIFVCILIIALDIGAGLLGLEAEVEQNKVRHLRLLIFECKKPSPMAFKLGLGAAALLGIAHVVANLLGGCDCLCSSSSSSSSHPNNNKSSSSPNHQLSLACLLLTWIVLGVGLCLLVIGIMANQKSRSSCGFSHHSFFSLGGIACFVHALFAVAFYVSATASH